MIPSQQHAAQIIREFYDIMLLAYPGISDEQNLDTAKRCADVLCDKIISIAPKYVQVEYQSIKNEIDGI